MFTPSSLSKMFMPRRSSRRSSYRFGGAGDGTGGMGPGFGGSTSFKNGYAPYFGSQEPFVNASEFWYPNTSDGAMKLSPSNQPTNYQSPGMLRSYAKFGRRKNRLPKRKIFRSMRAWNMMFDKTERLKGPPKGVPHNHYVGNKLIGYW